ncbi:hypothetical protein D3C81_1863120 [compost metagenome]
MQQRLRFELAQRFAYRHAADAEQVGQVLLAQCGAAGQAPVENRRAQGLFDHRTSQVSGDRAADGNGAEWVGLLCHDNALRQ